MINALTARSNAYKSVGVDCHADAMKKLYDGIDNKIEAVSKCGKMSIEFYLDGMVKKYMGLTLSREQLNMLADWIKVKYKDSGFNVLKSSYDYSDDITIEIGWFSL